MPSASREPQLLLADIEEACEKVLRFTANLDRDAAFAEAMRLDAILYNLHVIGEAVKKLPNVVRASRPGVPWREIAGMRDVVAHATFALDLALIWDAVQRDVPELLAAVRELRRQP
jgi:uncharacterized protein with HEPN domain